MPVRVKEFKPLEGYVFWTPQRAVSELQRFHGHFGTASSDMVQKNYRKLYKAFERNRAEKGWFADWDAFVKKADVDKALAHTFWTKAYYLKVAKDYFSEHPDATDTQFDEANPGVKEALARHGNKWKLVSLDDALRKVGLQREEPARPEPEPKPRAPRSRARRKPIVEAPPTRQPLPVITVAGKPVNVEDEFQMLASGSGTSAVRWNLILPKEVKRELLKFPEIEKKVRERRLSLH